MPTINGGFDSAFQHGSNFSITGSIQVTLGVAATLGFTGAPGDQAFDYIGIPYPTSALPGVSGSPSTIAVMPVEPDGAHLTGHDWWSGDPNGYDPITIATPTAPATVTLNEYVVDKFHVSATDSDQGDNSISGTVYGTTARPRVSLPSFIGVPAGTRMFIYGDGTPRPTAFDNNRGWDYDPVGKPWSFNGTQTNQIWIIGIDNPRLRCQDKDIDGGTHLIWDGIILDGDGHILSGNILLLNCEYTCFRNGALYGVNGNGLYDFDVGCRFNVIYNTEVAYSGYVGGTAGYEGSPFSGVDRHGVRPLWGAYFSWIIDCDIHSHSGDAIQAANSGGALHTQAEKPHYAYIAGCHLHHCGENAIDNKNSYHVIVSQCEMNDFSRVYNFDGGTGVISSNNDEGPHTKYHWIIYNELHQMSGAIRCSSDQDGEYDAIIGNYIHNLFTTSNTDRSSAGVAFNRQSSTANTGSECHWVNNTVHDAEYTYVWARDPVRENTDYFQGNIATDISINHMVSTGGLPDDPTDGDDNLHVNYNVFHGNTTVFPVTTEFITYTGNVVGDTANEDPLITNELTGDITLQAGSSAIDIVAVEPPVYAKFIGLYGIDIKVDYNGIDRPVGSFIDAGATEQ